MRLTPNEIITINEYLTSVLKEHGFNVHINKFGVISDVSKMVFIVVLQYLTARKTVSMDTLIYAMKQNLNIRSV